MIFHRSTGKATTKSQNIQKKKHDNNNMVKNITLKTALHQMHKQTKVRNVVKHHKQTLRKMIQHKRIMKGGFSFKDIFKSIFRRKNKGDEYNNLLQNPKPSASAKIKTSVKPSAIAKPNTDFTYYTNNKKISPIHNGDEFFIVINTSNPKECTISLHYKITLDILPTVTRDYIRENYSFKVKTSMIFTREHMKDGGVVEKTTLTLTNEEQETKSLPFQLLICNDTNPPYYYYNTFKVESENIFTDVNNDYGNIPGSIFPITSFFVDIKITLFHLLEYTTKGRYNPTYMANKVITHKYINLTKPDTLHIINFVRETSSIKDCRALIKKQEHDKSATLVYLYLDYLKNNLGMPETEYEMLSRSRMNTNIEFYYSGFRLDVTYNNGQTQSNANIINPQQAQLAY